MVRDNVSGHPEGQRTNDQVSRRGYLRGIAATGVAATAGVGTLTAASGTAAAASRSSYTIRTGTSEETTVYVVDAAADGPTAMVVGGMHGDEDAGYMSANKVVDWTIDRGKLVVLPEACKPAIRNDTREYYDGDLNRHFPSGASPESTLAQAIWDVVKDENIDVLWDLHSSSGLYKNGSGSGVGQGIFSTQAGDAERHRFHLQPYLNDNYVNDPDYEFTGATSTDGSKDMLKHKVGADLNTPAIIFETYRGIADARQRMFTTTAVQEFLQDEGLIDENVTYDGNGHAVNTSEDTNDKNSGMEFGVSNDFSQNVAVTDLEVRPVNSAADELRDHSYDEGKWVSELYVDADVQNGLTDINDGTALPTTIDLDADGHSDSADKEAILSGGSSSTFYLYQFKLNGSPKDMGSESVEYTVHYEMADGTRGFNAFTMTGDHRLEYNGDGRPINAPADSNFDSSGIHFTVTNNTHSDLTIEEMTIDPANANIDELRDHSYDEGKWVSELFIDADLQNGLTDIGDGTALPTTIDLDADGHSSDAQQNAVLSTGSSAGVFLYQFKAGGSPKDLVGEDVDITIDYTLDGGGSGTTAFTLSL